MNQPPLQNTDLQNDKMAKSRTADACPENNIHGSENRAIQGNDNLATQGDGNNVSQDSSNLNGYGSHFIKNMQADKVVFINGNYSEVCVEEKLNDLQIALEQEKVSSKAKATFVFTGTIDIVDEKLLKALEAHLRKIAKDTELTILKAEEGSIKITLEASPESLELLKNLFESGQLTEVLNLPIEEVQILGESTNNGDNNELNNKLVSLSEWKNEEEFEEDLHKLVLETCRHPSGSLGRRKGLAEIIKRVQNKLWKENSPYYTDAFNRTLLHFCRNLCEVYNPKNGSLISWLNRYLKFELKRIYSEQQYNFEHFAQEVSDADCLVPLAEDSSAINTPSKLESIREWVEADPTGELRNTHLKGYPEVNCQALILRRLPPEKTWKEMGVEFGVSFIKLSKFYKRRCMPLIQKLLVDESLPFILPPIFERKIRVSNILEREVESNEFD